MKKIVLLSIMACLFGIDAFAYKYTHKYENNSFACSLQNILRLNSAELNMYGMKNINAMLWHI